MTNATDDGTPTPAARLDRRTVLRGLVSAPLVGGIALSTTAAGGRNDSTDKTASDGDFRPTFEDGTDERNGERPIRTLECGESLTAQFADGDPRTPTGVDGVPRGHRYHEYRFEGHADERVYFDASTEAVPNPDYEVGVGDEPFYYAGDPALFLFDGDDLIGSDPEAGYWGSAHVAARLPTDGTYRLVATAAFDRDPTFEYELHANCSYRTPVTERPVEPIPLECGETIAGAITDDSVAHRDIPSTRYEVHAFDGRCGDCVTITTRSEAEPTRPRPMLFDPDGRYDGPRYERDGTYVPGAEATYTGTAFVLSKYRLPKTGTYTVWISSYGSTNYEYELSIECGTER